MMYCKQPRYYENFKCIGEKCPSNCCYGWSITWSQKEIDKLLNAENLSPELRELIEKSFVEDKNSADGFKIKLDKDKKCPFQTEEDLCRIQKELGAEYLSDTCNNYPRSKLRANDTTYRFCRISCPVITDQLLNNENSMNLTVAKSGKGKQLHVIKNSEKVIKFPIQKYRAEIFEFFYDLISDRKIDAETAIIFGALAASALTKIELREDYEAVPEQIKALRKQMHDEKMIESIDNIKPNVVLKLKFLPLITETITGGTATFLLHNVDGSLNPEVYAHGEQCLKKALNGRGYFWRNIALSLLFEFNVPFKHEKRTLFENYSIFVVAFACIKLNLIAGLVTDKSITMNIHNQEFLYQGDDKLIGLTSLISRGLCQNTGNGEKIIDLLNENGFNRPAYLALFVK